jgi:hypothetical protein
MDLTTLLIGTLVNLWETIGLTQALARWVLADDDEDQPGQT